MPHIWMSHVTHMNESCHTHKWVILHRSMTPQWARVWVWRQAVHRTHTFRSSVCRWSIFFFFKVKSRVQKCNCKKQACFYKGLVHVSLDNPGSAADERARAPSHTCSLLQIATNYLPIFWGGHTNARTHARAHVISLSSPFSRTGCSFNMEGVMSHIWMSFKLPHKVREWSTRICACACARSLSFHTHRFSFPNDWRSPQNFGSGAHV